MRATVPSSEVVAFIEALGIDRETVLRDVRSVDITTDKIIVTQFRRDDEGRLFAVGDYAATVTTEIAIERGA